MADGNGTLHVVFCNDEKPMALHQPPAPQPPPFVARVGTVNHGDDLRGTNPVAVVHGRLCHRNRKPGCQWCTGLRDRIKSRTIR